MQEKDEVIVNASGRGYWVYTCNERPQGRFQGSTERRTIHVIFADLILVAMECVSVSSSSDLFVVRSPFGSRDSWFKSE